jgi:hypothetical protein
MTNAPRPPSNSRPTRGHLRLPIVALAGVLCMGSGLGNPGCDLGGDEPSGPPECLDKCAVEGSYRLTFKDTSSLGAGCEGIGLSLPAGPLVITRNEGELRSRLHDAELVGTYFGSFLPQMNLLGEATVRNAAGVSTKINIEIQGTFTTQPDTTSEPSVLTGRYVIHDYDKCTVDRDFTATR